MPKLKTSHSTFLPLLSNIVCAWLENLLAPIAPINVHGIEVITFLCIIHVILYTTHTRRYYVAEGVRLYSQESWRIVTDNRGVELVGEYIKNVVDFYISQSQAANHAVREAACSCIAELGTKVIMKKI